MKEPVLDVVVEAAMTDPARTTTWAPAAGCAVVVSTRPKIAGSGSGPSAARAGRTAEVSAMTDETVMMSARCKRMTTPDAT